MSHYVSIHETCNVRPITPSSHKPCKLSTIDLRSLGVDYFQRCVAYRLDSDHIYQKIVESLKLSLAKALVYFYPLAGRFAVLADQTLGIDCNDEGVEFIEAYAQNTSVDEVIQDEVTPLVRSLCAMDGAINIQGLHLPLLVIQVTRLKDGIVVAFTGNHSVMDGNSFWYFAKSWAEMCRGYNGPSALPDHSRCFYIENPPLIPFTTLPVPVTQYNPSSFSAPNLRERIFRFSRETISHLKREANKGNHGALISSFQALSAHIWQAVTRARRPGEDEETTLILSVDFRSRVNPPLSETYFGNAIQPVIAKLTVRQVLDAHISELGGLLNTVIKNLQDSQIKENLKHLRNSPFLDVSKNKVHIGNSPRFPVYEVDFGWGKPIGMRSGWGVKNDGKIAATSAPLGDGSIEIEICLEPKNMEALLIDPLFLHPVTSKI